MSATSVVIASLLRVASGHGAMLWPLPRAGNASAEQWYNQGCQIGCDWCQGNKKDYECYGRMEPTLNPSLRTYQDFFLPEDTVRHNPWMAPGFAPVYSPCGLSGGDLKFHPQNGGVPAPGYKMGFDGRSLPKLDEPTVEWAAGSTQEVAWGITLANHGGGYAYRLCPATSHVTEECFQNHHLEFVGEHSWIEYGSGTPRLESVPNRTTFVATRTSNGTNPANAQWTQNPIPPCAGKLGGTLCTGCDKPQFEPPVPGLWGGGPYDGCNGCKPFNIIQTHRVCKEAFNFRIVDLVKVPKLPVGDYILSFRWDVEQTPQVWTQCADIKITNNETTV